MACRAASCTVQGTYMAHRCAYGLLPLKMHCRAYTPVGVPMACRAANCSENMTLWMWLFTFGSCR
eukprot:scaffold45336_cov32-Tisochrysis_lutea.AAC.1